MRIFILVFSLISLLICGVYKKNFYIHRDTIKWHERNQLQVNDFVEILKPYDKGPRHKHVPKDSIKLLKNYAWISSDIVLEYLSEVDSTDMAVFTIFNPQKSYYHNKTDSVNRYLLIHEEYHFHTVEAVARKARKEILASLNTFSDEMVKAILDSNKILLKRLHSDYDNFANHGAIELKQIQYQSKIDSMLAHYSAFSDPYIKDYFKISSKQIVGNNLYKTQHIRKDSLLIEVREDRVDTLNNKYKFMPLLAIDHFNIKNGQLQRVKAFFINNGLFDPAEIGKTVHYSIGFKHNAYGEKPFDYTPVTAINDTAYISFVVDEDLKSAERKEKFISVKFNLNINGRDSTFICDYNFHVTK